MSISNWVKKIKDELGEEIKILLYEPDTFMAELLAEVLKEADLEVTIYPSHKNLLKTLVENFYNLLILAIETGEAEDLEIIREAKKMKKDLLIYGMVEFHKNMNISSLFSEGADEIIFKPFSIGEFRARLWRLLRQYYLAKKIERNIIEDGLTGIYNRRYFEVSLREEAYRALRQDYPLTLLMIDLDKFKYYNDTYGHKAGDKILISIGEILLRDTRAKVDKPCRYGGDEFMVILPYTDWKRAIKIVERIFSSWQNKSFGPVTLSVGIAQLIDRGDLEKSVTDLINRADQAMYRAKKREGNTYEIDQESLKLTLGEEPPEEGLPFRALPLSPVQNSSPS